MSADTPCPHTTLGITPSPHAAKAGWKTPTPTQLAEALRSQSRNSKRRKTQRAAAGNATDDAAVSGYSNTFPAPLVLPDDDLALEPEHSGQGISEWLDLLAEYDGFLSSERKTIYVAAPPTIDASVPFVGDWSIPVKTDSGENKPPAVPPPETADVLAYLSAFYAGFAVRLLPTPLEFASWSANARSKRNTAPRYIALKTSPTEGTRIALRRSKSPLYSHQLSVSNLIDAAMAALPEDAYALLLLVAHDLYEDDEDEFICGRAYGADRVAVVSTARYNPALDRLQGVERVHAWPGSHCEAYVRECCAGSEGAGKKRGRGAKAEGLGGDSIPVAGPGGLQAAVAAAAEEGQAGLWLNRVCRTASHEIGHCFGIEHCGFYACIMQGSASVREDARQPPYLCPVDAMKIEKATGTASEVQLGALLEFCEGREGFRTFAGWLKTRLAEDG